jgi:hypothetical protein
MEASGDKAPGSKETAAVAVAADDADPAVAVIERLIRDLTAAIDALDRERSRLALYATVHRAVLLRLREALRAGEIKERKWVVNVQRQCLRLYLNSLEAYRAGQLDRVPASWLISFEAAAERDEIVAPQLVALGMNASLVHDMPIALFREEFYRRPSRYRRDYARLSAIVADSVAAALASASARYKRGLAALDVDDAMTWLLGGFDVGAAAADARTNAERLASVRHEGTVRQQFRVLDAETSRRAQRMLMPPLVDRTWLARALRAVENGWSGAWSAWVTAAPTVYGRILGADMERLGKGLRAFLGRPGGRGAAGTVWVERNGGLLSRIADIWGLPSEEDGIELRLEAVASGEEEHWLQIFGGRAFAGQHRCEDGRLVVSYGPWRFVFRLERRDGGVRCEQVGVGFMGIPMVSSLVPRVAVEAHDGDAGVDLRITLRLPLAGEVLHCAGRLTPR